MPTVDYGKLATEQRNPRSAHLDRLSPLQIVRLMNREDRRVLAAVGGAAPSIARAVERIAMALWAGRRVLLVGAGTSGRLGVIEAAECPPTFGTDPAQVQAVMAGGPAAVFRSKEGAEDSEAEARRAVARRTRSGDVVIGVAASGVTPFVRAALETARRRRARTVLVTCNPRAAGERLAEVTIALDTGPEVLTGSTRLKAGTACKMVLNMLTTGAMVRLGKVYRHWMVDLQPRSRKLVARAERLVAQLGGVAPAEARRLLAAARGKAKPAILMARKNLSYPQAQTRLDRFRGSLRDAMR